MEIPFEIKFEGSIMTIQPLDTIDFIVFFRNKRLALITPFKVGNWLSWRSKDICSEYAQQIGDLVASHKNM